jgi:MFS transporter, DHA1 family, multidrug resistance protein
MNIFKTTLLLSYICIASFSAAIITPALPQIGNFFQLTSSSLSWIISIFLAGYVIGQLIYGPIAQKFGSLNALRSGLIINLIGIIVCFIGIEFSIYNVLLTGRLITALGSASGLACTFILMHDLLNENEYKQAMPYTVLSLTLGIGAAVLIGGLVSEHLNWTVCFWVLLFHGIVMLVSTRIFENSHKQSGKLNLRLILKNYRRELMNTRLVMFSLIVGLTSSFSYTYSSIAPLYANHYLHQTSSQYGYWNLLNMAGMLIGGLLGASIIKRAGPKKLLLAGIIGFIPCCLSLFAIALSSGDHALWFFITTMFMYIFGGFLFPAGSYFALETTSDKSNGASMMSFINMLSAAVSVIIAGHLPISIIVSFASVISIFLIVVVIFAAILQLD